MITCTKKLKKITIPMTDEEKQAVDAIAARFKLPTATYSRIMLLKAASRQGKQRLILSAIRGEVA